MDMLLRNSVFRNPLRVVRAWLSSLISRSSNFLYCVVIYYVHTYVTDIASSQHIIILQFKIPILQIYIKIYSIILYHTMKFPKIILPIQRVLVIFFRFLDST